MAARKTPVLSYNARLECVLGRLLRIEAERGASFEKLLEYSPRLEHRLLEFALAARNSARARPTAGQDTTVRGTAPAQPRRPGTDRSRRTATQAGELAPL